MQETPLLTNHEAIELVLFTCAMIDMIESSTANISHLLGFVNVMKQEKVFRVLERIGTKKPKS